MSIYNLTIFLLLSFSGLINSTDTSSKKFPQKTYSSAGDYTKDWNVVDSLERLGLPQSALKIVEGIYDHALSSGNSPQLIKSVTYKLKYTNAVDMDSFDQVILDLEQEVGKSSGVTAAIMNSMLAELYWMYYSHNQWKIVKRSNTLNFVQDDLNTWSLDKIVDRVIKCYEKSLEHPVELQKELLSNYDDILFAGTKPANLRPTVYDFLAHRAIDFFINSQVSLTKPTDEFELKEDYYFSRVADFIQHPISTNDSLSLHFYGIKIIKDLCIFRISEKELEALLDVDLKRLNFLKTHSINDQKEVLFMNALDRLMKLYGDSSWATEVAYIHANSYIASGRLYNPSDPETFLHKWNYKQAVTLCDQVIEKFPEHKEISKFYKLKKDLQAPALSFTSEKFVPPLSAIPIKITYKNLSKVFVDIGKIDREKYEKLMEKYRDTLLYEQLFKERTKLFSDAVDLPYDGDMQSHSVEYLLNQLPLGLYVISISDNEDFAYRKHVVSYEFVNVTNLSYSQRKFKDESYEFYVFNRSSGDHLSGVVATAWLSGYDYSSRKYKHERWKSFVSDSNGRFVIPKQEKDSKNMFVYLDRGEDHLVPDNSFYSYNYYREEKRTTSVNFFLDRAIYRPGQTLFFKGIVISKDGDSTFIEKNFTTTVQLFNVNSQEVAKMDVTSNEYGSFSGTFTLPVGVLNGSMRLQCQQGSIYFSVEEYKRPKFEIKLLPFEGNYILNDSVKVKGSAISYAGSPLSDAQVAYRVMRTPQWRGWWYRSMNSSAKIIAKGQVETDEKGIYKISFLAQADPALKKSNFLTFNYTLYVDITDLNGETQSTSKNITVGYVAMAVDINLGEKIQLAADSEFELLTRNLNGEEVAAAGNIKVYSLIEPATLMRDRLWACPDTAIYTQEEWYAKFPGNPYKDENDPKKMAKGKLLFTSTFNTGTEKKLSMTKKDIPVGRYVMEILSKDNFGTEVSNKKFFTVYDEAAKLPVCKTTGWLEIPKNFFAPGDNVNLLFSSEYDSLEVLYELEKEGKIILKEWLKISNEQKNLVIPVKEAHRGNFRTYFTYVKDNRFYHLSEIVYVPYTNKLLDIEFATFRDKLHPGENEEWIVKIKGHDGEKVAAEMLATLYDESLDQFKINSWYLNVFNNYYGDLPLNSGNFSSVSSRTVSTGNYFYSYIPVETYPKLNWFGFNYYGSYRYYSSEGAGVRSSRNGHGSKKKNMKTQSSPSFDGEEGSRNEPEMEAPTDDVVMKPPRTESDAVADPFALSTEEPEPEENPTDNSVKVRSNFNETAFFYPHLYTDEKGEILIKFTIPESLTKWKMLGLAHSRDLKSGLVEKHLVTQKELMVMPNFPRFFRENDKITIPVKISNLSDDKIEGKATLQFFDAFTLKPLTSCLAKGEVEEKDFSVEKGVNSLLVWKIDVPEGLQTIQYRIIAKSGKFSDGEEDAVPVLTNRMLVTESLPLSSRQKGEKQFRFEKLLNSGSSSTIKHQNLTLEFTANPAWYAVQALPYLIEYPYECTEQTFSRYYANSLASHIANSNERIQKIFEAWRDLPDSKALLSNLEKNQELKAVLVEETPWVLQAESETERKKRLGLLFDLNKMSSEMIRTMTLLSKAQAPNGGWPWFEGMPDSRYITQHIVAGLAHLQVLKVEHATMNPEITNMLRKAVKYLDERLLEDYKYLTKHFTDKELENNHIGSLQIHHLYARSYFNEIKMSDKEQKAFDYYLGQAEKYWLSQSKYLQAMIGLTLHREDRALVAQQIIASLKEHAKVSEEMGMYWADKPGYYWYEAPIERQALMIELFDEVAKDEKSVNDLKVWLLKQKQTQDWKTTKATVDAIYALLLRGGDWLAEDEAVQISMGNITIDPKTDASIKAEAGTGYFKKSWTAGEISPEYGNITVTKSSDKVSWGAVYWQYFEQLDQITPAETPLQLSKKLFVERITDRGVAIEPMEAKTNLKIGDKVIVRIELKVDRFMEYVHMKDMRASGFEPINVISRYKYQDGLGYYECTKDAATNFFIARLPIGTYVFEYPLRVTHGGNFSNGVTSIQCMYAPEFASHSEGIRVQVAEKK